MPGIGITGGIASGKSTFRKLLLRRINADFVDTDQSAHDMLANDSEVKQRILSEISSSVADSDGRIDRLLLREIVFNDAAKRRALEQILHPAIRSQWMNRAAQAQANHRLFVVEIPLLFETESEIHLDRTIVVGCPETLQIERLGGSRGISPEIARKILASQLNLEVKMQRADHVIWNGGPLQLLDAQADLLASFLTSLP